MKKKEHLICKFNELQTTSSKRKNQQITTTHVKSRIINLTDIALTDHQASLLNLGPKFVPTEKRIPFMEIITATESVALNLEYHNKEADAKSLRQKVCHILNKNRNMKIKDNLPKEQRKALKEINNNNKVYSFDKGSAFVAFSEGDAINKIEEQLGKAKVIDEDPTQKYTCKIQKHLCKLRKEKKFTDKEYFEIYPSDPIPPRLYGIFKAYKPEKNYPMRTVVSTIGAPPYGISKYLVKIIQPTLNKSQHKIKNSVEFVNEAKIRKISPSEIQVSYDVVNLYPSIPLDKAIDLIVEYLKNDLNNVKTRTKLTLVDIRQLIELCESECCFLYNNLIWQLYNSGPIGLSIIVVLSECYIQRLEEKSIASSFALNISPKTFKRYVDDSHARFENKQKSLQFLEISSKQDSCIQNTIEFENNQKQLNFLDITITNNGTNSYDFKIFRKPAITNVQIKSNSNMAPSVSVSVFKAFLSRAYKICSELYIDEEIQFLINVFTENGYERKTLEKIAKNYLNELQNPPINNKDTSEDINKVVKLPWIPIIGPKLRQAFKKKNIKSIFTSGPNLKSLLCQNKTKLLPNSCPGVYELKCTCNSAYFGETKRKILARTIEHQQDSFKENGIILEQQNTL